MTMWTVGTVVAAAVVRDGAVLAQQRAFPADAAGLWEFPGGRVEPGESDVEALRRECLEELGVEVAVGGLLGTVVLPNGRELRLYSASTAGEPRAVEHTAVRWLAASELGTVDWLPADVEFFAAVRELLAG